MLVGNLVMGRQVNASTMCGPRLILKKEMGNIWYFFDIPLQMLLGKHVMG